MMCIDCWEGYDSPAIDTPLVRHAANLIADVDPCGYLHFVVADWNLDDDDLAFCADSIIRNPDDDPADQLEADWACLMALRGLTEAERASALALHEGFWKPPAPDAHSGGTPRQYTPPRG